MHSFFFVAMTGTGVVNIPAPLTIPFVFLLIMIATMPLSPPILKRVWDRFYPAVALGLGALAMAYFLAVVPGSGRVALDTLREYVSFMCLIGSLFVVAGGIHIKVKGAATPMANVVFLLIGAVAANIIGTTGASMVLIRPWIRMNKIRASPYHVCFFIFIVSNVGGALTPVGDPPLFLGYLKGVPFFWLIQEVIGQWFFTVGAILAAFYCFDLHSFKHMPRNLQTDVQTHEEEWRFEGLVNVLLLMVIVVAVFVPDIFMLREAVMIGVAVVSYYATPEVIHQENAFSFGPIKEVALLFAGIFATMMPVLGYLSQHGQEFGFTSPFHYYFASGALSSVLDNAPTYVNFLQLAQSTAINAHPAAFAATLNNPVATVHVLLAQNPHYVIGVSLGSVFFGAMTYIGNGPNFMVKSIAHDAGVHCPTFFRYITHYSLPVLLPILILSAWLFL